MVWGYCCTYLLGPGRVYRVYKVQGVFHGLGFRVPGLGITRFRELRCPLPTITRHRGIPHNRGFPQPGYHFGVPLVCQGHYSTNFGVSSWTLSLNPKPQTPNQTLNPQPLRATCLGGLCEGLQLLCAWIWASGNLKV